jgi:hypothetical protein
MGAIRRAMRGEENGEEYKEAEKRSAGWIR